MAPGPLLLNSDDGDITLGKVIGSDSVVAAKGGILSTPALLDAIMPNNDNYTAMWSAAPALNTVKFSHPEQSENSSSSSSSNDMENRNPIVAAADPIPSAPSSPPIHKFRCHSAPHPSMVAYGKSLEQSNITSDSSDGTSSSASMKDIMLELTDNVDHNPKHSPGNTTNPSI